MSSKKWTLGLFGVYLVVLTWIILLKMQTDLSVLATGVRAVNVIPLAGSVVVNGRLSVREILLNVLAFVPLGLYLSLWQPAWPVARRVLPGFGLSLTYETLQYLLAIGRSDITDLLANTLGCLAGVGLYAILARLLGEKTRPVLNAVALVCTVAIAAFLGLLLWANR